MFRKIEKSFIQLGGRCSFSRLFWDMSPNILKNCWDIGGEKWKKVKEEIDPKHIFTNEFVNSIFYNGKLEL